MRIIVQGSPTFNDYPVFLRAMGVAMSDLSAGDTFTIYTLGPVNINNHVNEFFNISQASLKSRGIDIKVVRANRHMVTDKNMFDEFYFFCHPEEWMPSVAKEFDAIGKVKIFRY